MMRTPMTLMLSLYLASTGRAQSACRFEPTGQIVPTEFVAGRVFVRASLGSLPQVRLYTDTGGGLVSLYPEVASRLGVPVDTTRWTANNSPVVRMVANVPKLSLDPRVPDFPSAGTGVLKFLIQDEPPPREDAGFAWDGRLGTQWFADRVWIMDYPRQRLYFNAAQPAGPADSQCWVSLGFKVDSTGRRINSFPRIPVRIDDETIQLLLDTGARVELTDSAYQQIGVDVPRHRGTSFISADRIEKWRGRHPDWMFVPGAESGTGFSMIRVPSITIGIVSVGPVWFTARPSDNFRRFMSQYTDSPIEGALGGSAFQYGSLVLDYPRARASFVLPSSR